MSWYLVGRPSSFDEGRYTFKDTVVFPILYNGIVYGTKNNPFTKSTYAAHSPSNYAVDVEYYSGSTVIKSGAGYQDRIYAEFSGFNMGAHLIYSSKTTTAGSMTLLNSSNITGDYRPKNTFANFPYTFSTCCVNFSIDDVIYNAIGVPDHSSNNIYIYKYNENDGTITPTLFVSGGVLVSSFQNKKISFGNTNQDIPEKIYDWINSNFNFIYPYTYTVKSSSGVTLAEQGELPPIRNITLSTIDNNVNMILTGSNGVDYTFTWSHTVPEGKIFLGLGYAATEKRASIPSGTTTAVTWDSDITVYEIYGKYVPPATTFTITLYQNTAENNRVDKTNYLTSVGSINGTLRSECSILRPSIIIAQDTLPMFNYVYIAVFGRYYFVTGITSVNFGLWRIELNTDVLMSYKEGVKALTAIIARQENDYNDNLIDTEIPTEKEPTVTYQEIPNSVLTTQDDSDTHSFVITVVGA